MKLERVLVVDDDPDFALIVEDCIRQTFPAVRVEKAFTGAAAAAADLEHMDLVILDHNLPDTNGRQVLETILKRSDVPVIMLTGESDTALAVESLKMGAADYLVKSGDLAETLPAVIQKVIREWEHKEESNLLRQQLIQSEKMSAVGLLAAGVAHEFNNLLCGMRGFAELAQEDPESLHKLPELVIRQSDKASHITRGLLSFSRRQTSERQDVRPEKLMDEVLGLVAKELANDSIQLVRQYDETSPTVHVNPAEIQQVFLNVVINARQAIERNGTVTVTVHRRDAEVEITVADTGRGIVPEDLKRVFDPFFTRKGALGGSEQEGTGLGLTISYNIVQEHGGRITAESVPGKGSQFHIVLPMAEPSEEKPEHAAQGPWAEEVPTGLKVLVVDDETVILDLLRTILTRLGQEVSTVTTGKAAVDAVRGNGFDVVFLDITMPGNIDGFEALRQMKETHRELPVFVITGRMEDQRMRRNLKLADGYIPKPFSIHDIAASLRQTRRPNPKPAACTVA